MGWQLEAGAQHEAAHAVVAYWFGMVFQRVCLEIPGKELELIDLPCGVEGFVEFLRGERYPAYEFVLMTLAGPVMDEHNYGPSAIEDNFDQQGPYGDVWGALGIMEHYGYDYEEMVEDARDLVTEKRGLINQVAAHLLITGELNYVQVARICGEIADRRPTRRRTRFKVAVPNGALIPCGDSIRDGSHA